MKKKLSLKQLNIKSFTTEKSDVKAAIKGGWFDTQVPICTLDMNCWLL